MFKSILNILQAQANLKKWDNRLIVASYASLRVIFTVLRTVMFYDLTLSAF